MTTYEQLAARLSDLFAVGCNIAECPHTMGDLTNADPTFPLSAAESGAYAIFYEPLRIYQLILTDESVNDHPPFAAFFRDWIGRWANVEANVDRVILGWRSPTEIDFRIFWTRGGSMNGGLIKHRDGQWGSHT